MKFQKLDTTDGEESTDATGGSDDWWISFGFVFKDTMVYVRFW